MGALGEWIRFPAQLGALPFERLPGIQHRVVQVWPAWPGTPTVKKGA